MEHSDMVSLSIPPGQKYALVARMALGGLGAMKGLDMDLIGDLGTAVNECFDCLLHQKELLTSISIRAYCEGGRMRVAIEPVFSGAENEDASLDLELTRGILETLMPDVSIQDGEKGVSLISFSMRV